MVYQTKSRSRTVGDVIPVLVPIVLAILQLILYLAIVGLESASVYYDAGRGTIYAGFWCSIVFFVTWIAMLSFVCCKKIFACGIYLVAQNIFSAIFAIILIVFTALFIRDPCLCYGAFCNIPNWDSSLKYNCTGRTSEKLPVLKALLSCAVLMLVSNLIFIIVYIISYISSRKTSTPVIQGQQREIPSYKGPESSYQYEPPPSAPTISEPSYYTPADETVQVLTISNPPKEIRSVRF